jgi:predicted nucleic acid-binding protein
MANETLIMNTGPLILLAKIDALDIVGRLPYDFICPRAVRDELDAGILKGHPAIAPAWLKIQTVSAPFSPLSAITLDRGEAEVIQLALELRISRVCLDELKGRRAARALGLQVTGALGLIGRAKEIGVIPAVSPYAMKLLAVGAYYSSKLMTDFLSVFGE